MRRTPGKHRSSSGERMENTRLEFAVVSDRGHSTRVASEWVEGGKSLRERGVQVQEETVDGEVGGSRTFFAVGDNGVAYEEEFEGSDECPEDAGWRLVTVGAFRGPDQRDGL